MTGEPRGSARERLLEAVLAGEIAATAPQVVAACAHDAQFAAELRQLLAIRERLQQRAAEIREDLQEPAGEHEGAASALVHSGLQRLEGPAPARRWRLWCAAAAAAVVLAAGMLWWRPWQTPAAPQFLGNLPVEQRLRHLEFRWTLAAGQYYRIQILDGERVVATEPRWTEPTWRPAPDLLSRWDPQWHVLVEVVSSDTSGLPWHRVRDWVPQKQ